MSITALNCKGIETVSELTKVSFTALPFNGLAIILLPLYDGLVLVDEAEAVKV